jgi:hypothetical protein
MNELWYCNRGISLVLGSKLHKLQLSKQYCCNWGAKKYYLALSFHPFIISVIVAHIQLRFYIWICHRNIYTDQVLIWSSQNYPAWTLFGPGLTFIPLELGKRLNMAFEILAVCGGICEVTTHLVFLVHVLSF